MSDELHLQLGPWPRIGRPPKYDLSAWTVTDNWSECVLVTQAEVDVFEVVRRRPVWSRAGVQLVARPH